VPRKKKGRRSGHAKKKARVKTNPNAFPVQKQKVRRMVTPLWILSGVAGLAAAVALIFDHKYAALWTLYAAIILGLGSLFAYLHTKIDEHESHIPKFSIISEVTIRNPVRDNVSYFVVYKYGQNIAASPINQMMYVRMTNETGTSVMIDYLSVEISKDKRTWSAATLIDIPEGRIYSPEKDSLAKCVELIMKKPQLKESVFDQNITDRATVKGWLCVERPYDGDNLFWRLRFRDTKGVQGTAEIKPMEPSKETFAGIEMLVVKKDVDLSGIKFVMYSERSKLP
jgi:hypothetical protein